MRSIIGVLVAAFLIGAAGCTHYGVTKIDQAGEPFGYLYFTSAGPGAEVIVDGADRGAALSFTGDKKHLLSLPSGRHEVVIRSGESVIYRSPVYVGAGARLRIDIPRGNQ